MSIKFVHASGAQVETTEEYAPMYESQGWRRVDEKPAKKATKKADPKPKSTED